MARKDPDIERLIAKIRKYKNENIVKAIRPFLRRGQESDLNPDLIKKTIEDFYKQVFVLNNSDKEFIESFKLGKVDLKVLFGKENFNHTAERHPGLVWALNSKRSQQVN